MLECFLPLYLMIIKHILLYESSKMIFWKSFFIRSDCEKKRSTFSKMLWLAAFQGFCEISDETKIYVNIHSFNP